MISLAVAQLCSACERSDDDCHTMMCRQSMTNSHTQQTGSDGLITARLAADDHDERVVCEWTANDRPSGRALQVDSDGMQTRR